MYFIGSNMNRLFMESMESTKSILKGDIHIPPSKSQTMRAILFASLAKGKSTVKNYLKSPDTYDMIKACQLIGAKIEIEDNALYIKGVSGRPITPDNIIDVGNSGQILLFVGAVCGLIHGTSIITGDKSVRTNRPVKELLLGLNQLNAKAFSSRNSDFAPFIVQGPISPGKIHIKGSLSQYVSAFLIATSFLPGVTEITVDNPGELPWIEVTLSWLSYLGIHFESYDYKKYVIYGTAERNSFEYTVPGDFSSAAYPVVASLITQSNLTLYGLDMLDPQGDKELFPALESFGANFNYDQASRSLSVYPSKLIGKTIDIDSFVDAITILAVLGCFSEGETRITGAKTTRFKECNRLEVMTSELKKLGANITETGDGLLIKKSNLHGGVCNSYFDHRVAMALLTAGFASDSKITVNNTNCIRKSYPNFLNDMQSINANISEKFS